MHPLLQLKAPSSEAEAARFITYAESSGVTGLLQIILKNDLPKEIRQAFEYKRAEWLGIQLEIEEAHIHTVGILNENGIVPLVFKGIASSRLYPDPSYRQYNDVDYLLRQKDISLALSVLKDSGLRELLPQPKKRFFERYGKDHPLLKTDAKRNVEIDLHRTVLPLPLGHIIDLEDIFNDALHVDEDGAKFLIPSNEHGAAISLFSYLVSDNEKKMSHLIDTMMYLDKSDQSKFTEIVNSWGISGVFEERHQKAIHENLAHISKELGLQLPIINGLEENEKMDELARQSIWETKTGRNLHMVRAIPWNQKPMYLYSLLLTDKEYRESRGWDRMTPFREIRKSLVKSKR